MKKLARKQILNIGTWNIQSLSNNTLELFKEIEKSNFDIVALTETKKRAKEQKIKMGTYILVEEFQKRKEQAVE